MSDILAIIIIAVFLTYSCDDNPSQKLGSDLASVTKAYNKAMEQTNDR